MYQISCGLLLVLIIWTLPDFGPIDLLIMPIKLHDSMVLGVVALYIILYAVGQMVILEFGN